MANSDMMRVIRDDNIDTCVVFSPLMEAPWYTDFIIPLYFVNKTETVTMESSVETSAVLAEMRLCSILCQYRTGMTATAYLNVERHAVFMNQLML